MEHTVHYNVRLANPNPSPTPFTLHPNPNPNQVCSDLLYNAELAGEVGRRCGEALVAAKQGGRHLSLLVTDLGCRVRVKG